jgi:hypothetical protein
MPPAERAEEQLDTGSPGFGCVPRSASFDVERFDSPRDETERIGAAQGVGSSSCDHAGDPVRHIPRKRASRRAFGAEFVEEHVQRSMVAAGRARRAAAVMIDDHDEIPVPTL